MTRSELSWRGRDAAARAQRAARRARLVTGLGLAVLLPASGAAAARYAPDEKIIVSGVVSDSEGRPLPDLEVVLEAARSGFNVRTLAREPREATRAATTTNARGEYSLAWSWDAYYNTFTIQAGVTVREPEGARFHVLAAEDLSRRILRGSPVVAALTVADTDFLETWREFQAALDSPDEERVYRQMGTPDHLRETVLPASEEVSWWYFERGRVYRFRDGRLESVGEFEPVTPF